MTMKLPPWDKMELDCLNATLKDAGYSIENRRDVLRRCEMHDRLLEALEVEAAHSLQDDFNDSPEERVKRYNRIQAVLTILKENQ